MIVWRVSNHLTLDGAGALRASARWHTKGHRVVYCAPNPATALLEMLVHAEISVEDVPTSYKLLKIQIPDDTSHEAIDRKSLTSDWSQDLATTRSLGDNWLEALKTALLYVPNALVPETTNILINPLHPHSRRISVVDVIEHPLDRRLV